MQNLKNFQQDEQQNYSMNQPLSSQYFPQQSISTHLIAQGFSPQPLNKNKQNLNPQFQTPNNSILKQLSNQNPQILVDETSEKKRNIATELQQICSPAQERDNAYSNYSFNNNQISDKNIKSESLDYVPNILINQNKYFTHYKNYKESNNQESEIQIQLFMNFLKQIMKFDRDLETKKLDLIEQENFYIQNVFDEFDFKKNGMIFEIDFREGLKKYNIIADYNDIILLFRSYTIKVQSFINFQQFSLLFLPIIADSKRTQIVLKQQPQDKVNILLGYNHVFKQNNSYLYDKIDKIFRLHLNTECNIEDMKCQMDAQKINLENIFKQIDKNNNNYITDEDLLDFLISDNFYIKKDEIQLLMARIDKSQKNKIQYHQFYCELIPRLHQKTKSFIEKEEEKLYSQSRFF